MILTFFGSSQYPDDKTLTDEFLKEFRRKPFKLTLDIDLLRFFQTQFKKNLFIIAILTLLIPVIYEISFGYIMPAEQLIGFMAKNFSKFETVVIIQNVIRQNEEDKDQGKIFKEQIWMKSPDLFQARILDQQEGMEEVRNTAYRQLLIANGTQRIEQILSRMGINLESVGFTRIDGIIAYRIGDREPESPKILIEKERFLPLLIIYRPMENLTRHVITVRFGDYRKLEEGWYPFETTYSLGQKIKETYSIQSLQANGPIDTQIFYSSGEKPYSSEIPEKEQEDPDEERLRQIIKTFEKKYQ